MRMEKRSMALFTVLVQLALSGCALQPGLYGLDAELTEQEKSEPEAKYYTPVFAPLPPEVEEALIAEFAREFAFHRILRHPPSPLPADMP